MSSLSDRPCGSASPVVSSPLKARKRCRARKLSRALHCCRRRRRRGVQVSAMSPAARRCRPQLEQMRAKSEARQRRKAVERERLQRKLGKMNGDNDDDDQGALPRARSTPHARHHDLHVPVDVRWVG